MPRLPNSLLRRARAINPLYPLLLQTCRTIPSAHNELRWLREHVETTLTSKFGSSKDVPGRLKHNCVAKLARRRARGEPLQYLLGSQPFGNLDIKCAKGVLIPRQCTEAYTERLARFIAMAVCEWPDNRVPVHKLRIVDFCSGTGCIPLLLLSLLSKALPIIQKNITVVDISATALTLSKKNYIHNLSNYPDTSRHSISFEYADILDGEQRVKAEGEQEDEDTFTVVTCNPPYISKAGFEKQTERSVRNYEPRLALVPRSCEALSEDETIATPLAHPEDIFYHGVAKRAESMKAKMVLFEVAGTEQAVRVAGINSSHRRWHYVEIWGDDPDAHEGGVEDITAEERREIESKKVRLRGSGSGRSVLLRYCGDGVRTC